jgi:hypothetical protein
MRIYIAARAKYRTEDVKKIQDKLRSMGHEITYDWAASNDEIRKPYREESNRLHNASKIPEFLQAAASADVFILLDDPGLRGAYIELGAFMYSKLNDINKKVFVVGPDSHERESVFESPEYFYFIDTIEEVYQQIS